MLKLKGKSMEGEEIEFDIDEIQNVFPHDGVLYVGNGHMEQIPVLIESIAPAGQHE